MVLFYQCGYKTTSSHHLNASSSMVDRGGCRFMFQSFRACLEIWGYSQPVSKTWSNLRAHLVRMVLNAFLRKTYNSIFVLSIFFFSINFYKSLKGNTSILSVQILAVLWEIKRSPLWPCSESGRNPVMPRLISLCFSDPFTSPQSKECANTKHANPIQLVCQF